MARSVGLQGKLTATVAEKGSTLYRTLAKMAEQLGAYPHAAMEKKKKAAKPRRKAYIGPGAAIETVRKRTYQHFTKGLKPCQ